YLVKSNAASLVIELLEHPAYRDVFPTPGAARHDGVARHGPYALSDIRFEDFEAIDAPSARQAIEAFWADERYGSPEASATEQIRQLIGELDLAHVKTLRLEKSHAPHERPPDTLHGGYQEFI